MDNRMKTALFYFSATGNTARAVELISERLKASGHEVSSHRVEGPMERPQGAADLTLVAFPVWAWAAPHFILDFVRHLPLAQGAPAAVFATCGGFGGQAVGEVSRLLRRRGYGVIASGEAAYPDNWLLAVNPPVGEELESALAEGDEQVSQFADSLLSEKPDPFRCAWLHRGWSRAISLLFRTAGRRALGSLFIADDTCTSCGLCESMCPVNCIRMEGEPSRPRWNASCAACYRCINLCPARAIQISVPLMLLQLGLNVGLMVLCGFPLSWLYHQLASFPGLAQIGLTALATVILLGVLTVIQFTVLSRALSWLASWPPLRPFFLRNYTHRFGRYRAPGFQASPSEGLQGPIS